MLLIDPGKLRELEEQANGLGYSFDDMMRVAGSGLAEIIENRWEGASNKEITGLVGGGKNGADTLIALFTLQNAGWKSTAILLTAGKQLEWVMEEVSKSGCEVFDFKDRQHVSETLKNSDLILDGILGTGFKPPLKPELEEEMKYFYGHCARKTIVAVDSPSGVDCATGTVSNHTLHAALTVSMEGIKSGLMKFPAFNYVGELEHVDVGILKKVGRKFDEADLVIDETLVAKMLPTRKNESHKGTFGTVLVCGGSANFPGAPVFVAKSAYKIGAGLVKTAIPERIYDAIVGQCLESTWIILGDENGVIAEPAGKLLKNELTGVECLAIGPGMGHEETTFRFMKELLSISTEPVNTPGIGFLPSQASKQRNVASQLPPMVIDADGLRLLAKMSDWHKLPQGKMILTPHPGEMSILTGLPVEEIQKDRMEICRKYAIEWQQYVVLKGALTVVASPEGRIAICPVASSALAKAGSGDLLTGVIAGLIAQGAGLFEAAASGVWIHANAGLTAAKRIGSERCVVLKEILAEIPEVIRNL